MGGKKSRPIEYEEIDRFSGLTDKFAGLTNDQKCRMLAVYKEIENSSEQHETSIFLRYLEKYPRYFEIFENLHSMTGTALKARIHTAAKKIILSIGILLNTLIENPDKMQRSMEYLALTHRSLPLEEEDFLLFKNMFVTYLKSHFPEEMTPDTEAAWTIFLTKVIKDFCGKIEIMKTLELRRKQATIQKKLTAITGAAFYENPPDRDSDEYRAYSREFWSTGKEDH